MANWIQNAIKKPGALHKSLGVPMDKNIPMDEMHKAMNSSNDTLRRRAQLAATLRGFHK